MQTLFIPDIIHIAFSDKDGNSLRQENILIGIHTFATHKNDVDISPFLSDKTGQITITKDQIKQRVDNFISYGIMDYNSIEYAKPNIQIYFWGNSSLDRYIDYWSSLLDNKKNRKQSEAEIKMYKKFEKDFAEIRKREAEELEIFSSCFNRNTKQRKDIILVEDIWDKAVTEKNYTVTLNA
jgi:DNA replication protein DnaD